MRLSINSTDITGLIAYQGVTWERKDIAGGNSGRTLDGTFYRDRIASKMYMSVTLRPLVGAELSSVLSLIAPEYVRVSYDDPQMGYRSNVSCYVESVPSNFLMVKAGDDYWTEVKFTLIER